MNKARIAALFLLGGIVTGALSADTSLGKFTLAPGEKKTIAVESQGRFKAGFLNESAPEQIKSCKHACIQMSVVGDPFSIVAASVGTTIEVIPRDGRAEIVLENLEAFPIPISVFRQ